MFEQQKNNELKDRVQVLESKLFDALSYNQQVSSKKKSKPSAADDNDNQEDDGVTTVTTTANVAALELQCQQLQRLNAQLEYKVRELQAKEKNSKSKILKSNQAIDPTSTKEAATFIDKLVANVGFGVTLGPSSLSSLQKILVDLTGDDRTHLHQIWRESLMSLQDANKKTIYELANEVKSLSTTVATYESNKQQHIEDTNKEIKKSARSAAPEPVRTAKNSSLLPHVYSALFGVIITILTMFWKNLVDRVKSAAS